MAKAQIQVDHVARIEGHGDIHLVIEDGEVKDCKFVVTEAARLFESMVVGRPYYEVPYISSRVCGICSASHTVTDIVAIERCFGIEVSARTDALRELLVYGSFLQNHATHLFVFAAPDFLGHTSVFPLANSNRELYEGALGLKAMGNKLCTLIGGRSIHPITAVVGGFTDEISSAAYRALADELESHIEFALSTVDLFNDFSVIDFATEGDLLAMVKPDAYPVIGSSKARFVVEDLEFCADDLDEYIEEYPVDHSAALFSRVRQSKRTYMASALARINASWDALSEPARFAAAKAGLRPPELNPFANNIAQAVEIVDALVRCAELCRNLADADFGGSSKPVTFDVKAGRGVGFSEAPRGALFHVLDIDGAGKIEHASIITPTSQNIANMQADMRALAQLLVDRGMNSQEIEGEIEKLVRAYDPCLSCSVH